MPSYVSSTDPKQADTSPATPDLASSPQPIKIDRFEILGEVGAGGMGRVFRARDPDLNRDVALKQIDSSGQHGPSVARFLREAQAMAALSHPNVVPIYQVGEVDHNVFIAMELVEGQTMNQWLDAEKRSWQEILGAYVQAGMGLAAAHAAGIVHRDFKPQNVLVGADARVRVADFGLARAGKAGKEVRACQEAGQAATRAQGRLHASSLTAGNGIMGTPAYMSPEQRRPLEVVGPASDQFSFCVALFEGLHGVRPYAGATAAELRAATEQGARQRHVGYSQVPAWLHVAIARGLARDPAARWPSMSALLAELTRDREVAHRRMRIIGLGLVAVVLGVTSGARFLLRNSHEFACQAAGDEIAEIWDARQMSRLKREWDGPTSERWILGIDRHVNLWKESMILSCVSPSPEVVDWPYKQTRVSSCFNEARDDLATLVDVVTRMKPLTPWTSGAWYWPEIERCVDGSAAKDGRRYPDDTESRRRWQTIRGRIITADFIAGEGRPAEADAILVAALGDARSLPGSTLTLTAMRTLIRTRFEAGWRRRAWEALGAALAIPGGVPGEQLDRWKDDLVHHLLLGAASKRRGQPGMLVHEGGSAGYEIPITSNIVGALRTTVAKVTGVDAVPLLGTHTSVLSLIATVSAAYVGLGDFKAAEAFARTGISLIGSSRARPGILSDVYLALGRANIGLGQLGSAWSALREARAAAERPGAATASRRGWIALAFAELRLASGDLTGAASELEAAEQLAADIEGDDDRFIPALALVSAELQVRHGELVAAEASLRRARRALIESHGVTRRLLVETHLALSRLALAQGHLGIADDELSEALRLGEEIAGTDHISLAPILTQVVQLRRAQGNEALAQEAARRARELLDGQAANLDHL